MKIVIVDRRKGVVGMLLRKLVRHPQGGGAVKQETTYRQGRERPFPPFSLPFCEPSGAAFSGGPFLVPAYSPSPRIDMG